MRYLPRPPALLLVLLAAGAGASTVEQLSLQDLTQRAESIFLGSCVAAEPHSVEGQLYTLYRFRVAQTIKGRPAALAEIHVPGGSAAGLRTTYAGMPAFAVGEEAVVFATGPDAAGYAWPVGLGQGHFRVLGATRSGPRHVRQMLDGLHLVPAGAPKPGSSSGSAHPLLLEDFLEAVQALVPPSSAAGEAHAR